MKEKRKGKKQRIDFDGFYTGLYAERWPALRSALEEPSLHTELTRGLVKPYYLDAASLLPVESLKLKGASNILDLCAAPGGKALAIAGDMDPGARLTVNDRSSNRRARLHRVLQEHLAPELLERVTVSGHDASRWGLYEQNLYDRVLADVPCSSERHLVQEPKHLVTWSPARTRHLAVQAYAILAAGFTALAPGGILVYSTCALSPGENDGVVAKLLKRNAESCRLLSLPACSAVRSEASACGRIVLPDSSEGFGPIFYAAVTKLGE
jgi:5-methylcytosine rRNA methyltransferase NSUN4